MKELLEFLVRSLVDEPDKVSVTEVKGERSVVYEVRVSPGDTGKIIGKQGRVAKALRTIVKAASAKSGTKAVVEILE
ncbi:KH domain-containing protein [Candidatus Caldatribacterium sp.]|uniref:KH domain-containing protein n=1 Tax=Candidatus Caldatribacterium sp. TaxID=2282143 RepID=UPI0029911235|nr:KH domain-containing protein [Candidatus Caldatribacterium sp.]MDW8080517.1 KH domain-containing protein [Candidatus Calescibacterium sp.]